jgi:uncharacterized protein YjiS (DUF1127 family)
MSSSTIETRTSRIDGLGAVSWRDLLVNSIRRRFGRLESELRLRRDLDDLMSLDDRILADIGLSRGEIDYVVRHGRRLDRENRLR